MNVIVTDLDDTLIEDVDAARKSIIHTLASLELPHDYAAVERATRLIRKLWKAHPHRNSGSLRQVSGWEALWLPRDDIGLPDSVIASLPWHEMRVWGAILAALHGDPAQASAAAVEFRRFRSAMIRPLPGVPEALEALGQKHLLWLATNGLPAHQLGKLSAAGLIGFFTRILISGEIGAPKADPAFAAVIRQALRKSRGHICLVVGDSVSQDLQLAANGGWPAAHICSGDTCEADGLTSVAAVDHVSSITQVVCDC